MSHLIERAQKDLESIEGISFLGPARLDVPWAKEGKEGLDDFTYKTGLYQRCDWEDLECVKMVFAKFLKPGRYYLMYFAIEEVDVMLDFDLWIHVHLEQSTTWFEPLWNKGKNVAVMSENLDFHLVATEITNKIAGPEIQVFKGQSI